MRFSEHLYVGRTNLSPIKYYPLWKWRWALVLKVLLNPTLERDASHSCVVIVHSSLGQRLIRHEWEVSFPNVGLSKTLRTKAQRHFQRGQYLIGGRDESPPTKRHLLGLKGKPPPSPSLDWSACTTAWAGSFWDLHHYYTCVVVIHSSLGQRLIRHEWEMSLPDVGLNKSLRTKAQCHFQRGQYQIGGWDESPPTKKRLLRFKGKPPPSPFVGSCVTRKSALPHV